MATAGEALEAAPFAGLRPSGSRLVLMRHAKSDYPLGVRDHDRPLSERGRSDAAAAGRWLAEHASALLGAGSVVLVSSSVRTQQTWEIAGASLHREASVERGLYEASDQDYVEVLREGLHGADSALVIGHNPSTESVARRLVTPADTDAYRALMVKFPTSAIAVIDVPDTELRPGTGRLAAFVIPRGDRAPAGPE